MLLKSEFHSISGQSPRTVGYDYDAMGNRTSATIANPATAATLTRRLTWGQDLAGSPSLQGAGGVGGLLMVEEITSTTNDAYHFHYDGNGNVTEITDHLGVSVATYRYDAFGNTLVATGTYAATNRYRFSTKPLDHEVTTAPLYYYGYRYYDSVTGRWPSRDPIGERGGVNLYGFVGNDGVDRIDLLGLEEGDYNLQQSPRSCTCASAANLVQAVTGKSVSENEIIAALLEGDSSKTLTREKILNGAAGFFGPDIIKAMEKCGNVKCQVKSVTYEQLTKEKFPFMAIVDGGFYHHAVVVTDIDGQGRPTLIDPGEPAKDNDKCCRAIRQNWTLKEILIMDEKDLVRDPRSGQLRPVVPKVKKTRIITCEAK